MADNPLEGEALILRAAQTKSGLIDKDGHAIIKRPVIELAADGFYYFREADGDANRFGPYPSEKTVNAARADHMRELQRQEQARTTAAMEVPTEAASHSSGGHARTFGPKR